MRARARARLPLTAEDVKEAARAGARRAGEWRGIQVAIKTLIFQDCGASSQTAAVASEAAIASNLVHRNIVATYSHDICNVASAANKELGIFKFYLIQVRHPLNEIS